MLRELYELQKLDTVRAEKQRTLDAIRAELADESNLRQVRARLATIQAQYTSQNALRRDAQLAVEQIEAREELVQDRLYGGAVTNPRELEAFQEEQTMLSRQKSEAEDILLERMVATEDLQEALASTQEALATIEERRSLRVPELRSQGRALSGELEGLNLTRDEMLPQFPPQMLSTYETLRASRDGQAVSKVIASRGRDVCEACRVALPRSDIQRLRTGESLVQCNNCRRILYME
ncbi:MAG: hypothetical protein F4X34_06745 [Chloroflexi bacterium]|nr:hypothetical protein [Chloroflexota bacterium]